MVQKPYSEEKAEVVIVTHHVSLCALEDWKDKIDSLNPTLELASCYAVEGGE